MTLARQPKKHHRNPHHQKRHGLHQKRSEHFVKTYWPYLPMMLVVVVGLAINSLWSPHVKPGVLAYATEMSSSNLLVDTNAQRSTSGEAALNLNGQLNAAAQAKANDMVSRNYWSHNTPDGTPPWVFISNAGYNYSAAGENLAYGFVTSADTITGWMNSAEHRANILNASYKDVGFGFANSPNFVGSGQETIVVAEYGAPAVAVAPVAPKPATPAPAPQASTPAHDATTPAPEPTSTSAATSPSPAPAPTTVKAEPSAAAAAHSTTSVAEPSTQKVSRIQLVTNGAAPWSLFVASTVMSAALLLLLVRHGLGLRRVFVYGENFIVKHKLFDFLLITATVASFVLTRTSGFIR